MSFLKKGPELKLSEIKVPNFVADVYYDLKDRHLLPIAVLLLVAIVVAPIALSRSSDSAGPEPSEAEAAVATPSAANAQANELVAESTPGLRDYRRRLRRLEAKDPFVQKFTEEESSGSSGSETGGSAGEGGFEGSTAAPVSPETETPASDESGSDGDTPAPDQLTYFSYAIDVRVTGGGSQAGGDSGAATEPTVRRKLPELTMLPSRETPAAVFMGATKDAKKALFVISSDVEGIFGDGRCVLGSQKCELLMLEPGVPETFVYGRAGRTFKLELLKIELVETDELNRAPLGKPKSKQKQGR